jgi:THO complex subunit 4
VNSAPKAQPKSAVPVKNGAASTRGKTRGAKKARNPRPAKKTAEELDSEMADYWESGANGGEVAATSGAAPANGDANMDEIL